MSAREPTWRRYLRFWRPDPHADVDEELRFHIESRIADNVAAGMTIDAARREARDRFGDVEGISHTLHAITRDREATMRRTAWFDVIRQDLTYAFRQLGKNPGFTAVAVLTLALGIGANSAIFSVLHSVMLRPLPYAHAERILTLRERMGANDTRGAVVTFGNFGTWREQARGFDAIGAYSYDNMILTGAGDPRRLPALRVTEGYFRTLYIPPAVGRYFNTGEDQPGAPASVVLSYALWRSQFNGDASIVGRSIVLSGTPHVVIGVAPPEYALTANAPPIYLPLVLGPRELGDHADHELAVVARLRDGESRTAALADLTRIQTELARQYPRANIDGGIIATALRDSVIGSFRQQLMILTVAVALVLLIACVNVTNLLLARAAVRRTEIAVRAALGAGRKRIMLQLLAESVTLSIAGAVAGLGVAALGVKFLVAKGPPGLPRLKDASLNPTVLLFTLGVAVLCGLAFGVIPALRATRLDLQQTLRGGGRNATVREGLRSALVVAEMALALMLLIGAGLLVRSALILQSVPLGFDPHATLVANTALPGTRYPSLVARAEAFARLQAAAAALPGVTSAALVNRIPIGAGGFDCGARKEGTPPSGEQFDANRRAATGNFFATIGLPLLRGRTFAATDVATSPPVAVINVSLARALFGDADPIGKRFSHCDNADAPKLLTVVGVTGDMHARGQDQEATNEVYSPMAQWNEPGASLLLKTAVAPSSVAPALRRAVADFDPLLALSGVNTMEVIVERSLSDSRFRTFLFLMLGLTGLVLASIGIYGIIAYFVSQRSHEIGIRMALGADARRVVRMVVGQGLALAVSGVLIGLAASWLAARWMESLVFGITTRDPLTFVVVASILLVVAVTASLIPARRATRVDPLASLRAS